MIFRNDCTHCRGEGYVLIYWFEKLLEQNGIHMTDIPPEIFKKIPLEFLCHCHCNIGFLHFTKDESLDCPECQGTTFRFTEEAENEGYRLRKISSLTTAELKTLPCEYFERCPCGYDEKGFKPPEKKKVLTEVFELLKIKLPKLGIAWRY